jgi:hypothetical protein
VKRLGREVERPESQEADRVLRATMLDGVGFGPQHVTVSPCLELRFGWHITVRASHTAECSYDATCVQACPL